LVARLPAEVRRAQLVEAAQRLILEQGYLPLAPERLAREAGVSKASVYGYFPDPHALVNAVLARQFDDLAGAGLPGAVQAPSLEAAALAAADLYFRHVAERGPVAHVILRDVTMARRVRPDLAAFRNRIAGRLIRLGRRELGLPAREAVGAFNLMVTIPEEAGRLVWQGDLSFEAGVELCGRLVAAGLHGLKGA
jgi:AcrR family transcriptional regulator